MASREELVDTQPLVESYLLPDETKITLVLEAAPDLRDAERHLREMEIFRSHGVQGAGSLARTWANESVRPCREKPGA